MLLPGFADDLARSQHELQQHPASPQQQPAAGSEGGEVLAQDWWELHDDGDLRGECGGAVPCLRMGRAVQQSCSAWPATASHLWSHARLPLLKPLPPATDPTAVTEQTGDYILVEREDVVRALASFIAEYIGEAGGL